MEGEPVASSRRLAPIDHTPGFLGYVLAIVVAWAVLTVGLSLGAWILLGLEDPGPGLLLVPTADLAELVGSTAAATGVVGLVAGPIGVIVVDYACDGFPQQWVHVAAAGAVGVAITGALAVLLGVPLGGDALPAIALVLAVGTSTALGRWAVVPLTGVARERRAPGDPWWTRWSLR